MTTRSALQLDGEVGDGVVVAQVDVVERRRYVAMPAFPGAQMS